MTDFPAMQKWVKPDGSLTPEAVLFLTRLTRSVLRAVEVADETEIPDPPDPNTLYYEVA